MTWKIKITASAKQDINEIKRWYKQQSLQALENFIKELTAFIESLQEDIAEHRPVYKTYRKLSLRKFPYAIFYQRKEKESIVEINAVFHHQRELSSLTKRLGNEE